MTGTLPCASVPTATSNSVTVTVHPLMVAPVITQVGNTLVSNSVTGNQWYYAQLGAPIGGATSQSYVPITTGYYYTIVIDPFGCGSDTSNTIYIVITGIGIVQESNFSIYPNPSNGNFIIQLNAINEKVNFELFDAIGQLVIKNELANSDKKEFNMNYLANGVYTIRITTSKATINQKVIIQK